MENLYQKHGLVSRTYSKKSLIMASTFGSMSRSFMTMLIPSQDELLTNRPVASFVTETLKNPRHGIIIDVPSTSDRRLIEFENQVQRLMEAHLAPTKPRSSNEFHSSLAKQNRNPSSPKRVHFVNSIVILNKEDEAKEEGNVKTSKTEYRDHEMNVESEEEFKEETKDEIKEEEEDSSKQFDTSPTMKELRLYYNWIMSKRLGPRRKPSNLGKICNFMVRVNGLKVFVGNFTYECDFMVLEDTTSVIDHDLGSVIFGKPFVEAIGLIYDREEGTITFEKDKDKIVFKVPHKMEMFKHIDFTDMNTDRIPPFVIEGDDDSSRKTHYSDSFDLGPEYKHDENVCRAIQSLIAMKAKRNKGKVT
ncbi:hypothetical protein Tco_0016228 [Tanacetum coccineum]